LELIESQTGIQLNNWKTKANFIDYFKNQVERRPREPAWQNTLKHIRDFTQGKVSFREIDEKFCNTFKEYLQGIVSPNTAHTYFSRFKSALNQAVRDKIISLNPARHVQIKKEDVRIEFLTFEELSILKETPCRNNEIRNAFMFSCFTGLRLADVEALTSEQVRDGYIHFRQKKTRDVERLKLSQSAMKILNEQGLSSLFGDDRIFRLPSRTHMKKILKKWINESRIGKRITFHCARHTFATLCLTHDIDLYTVSKLLGHRDIKSTQIYAKLIDKKKDEAIDRLPELA
jgi:integrase